MRVRCWGCGQDLDAPEADIRRAEREALRRQIEEESESYRQQGFWSQHYALVRLLNALPQ